MAAINNIMCAVDFSEISPRVASYAQILAKSLKASVQVVYVAPGATEYLGFYIQPRYMDKVENIMQEIFSEAEKTLDAFIQKNFSGIDVTGKVLSGYAPEEIIKFLKDNPIDLIIIGTHGRTGIGRVLFGSVAEKVVKSSKAPVLTVRP